MTGRAEVPRAELYAPDRFAERMADYMLTRVTPWRDPEVMREAVCEFIALVTGDIGATYDMLQVLGLSADEADQHTYGANR